jgi:hypothetical protein
VFLPDRRARFASPAIRRALFSFLQLYDWSHSLTPQVFTIPGVNAIDIDEAGNRIVIGIDREDARAGVHAIVRRLGVPPQAVAAKMEARLMAASTLQDYFRNIGGGLQVQSPNWTCTIGFSTIRNGVASFATNGHCTTSWGTGSEGTPFSQCCTGVPSNYIGNEYLEAQPISSAQDPRCPVSDYECKLSDIALGAYTGSDHIVGVLLRPINRSRTAGSLTIDSSNPYLYITQQNLGPLLGDWVDKIGRTTGWTYGPVTSTCKTDRVYREDGASFIIICFDEVQAGVGAGDSGSPVFVWSGGTDVTMTGQLFGGRTDNGTQYYGFSIFNFINGDPSIGFLQVTF